LGVVRNQGKVKVKARPRGSITLWAWAISITVHLIVFSAFAIAKFSKSQTQGKQQPIPVAKVSEVKRLLETASIITKPKIKKATPNQLAKNTQKMLPTKQIFESAKSKSQELESFSIAPHSQDPFSLPSNSKLPYERIEFFGSFTNQRKICYLIDCSGSMRGVFGQVQKKLRDSIASLQQDQYFCIIFFGDNRLLEFENGQMRRATQKAKSAAYDFIESANPAGQTNALAALERAVQIPDNNGAGPSVIYFLTDGFELTTEDVPMFSQKITNLLRRFAPKTVINTIGFWPQDTDCKMLEIIARQSGGEFILVKDN